MHARSRFLRLILVAWMAGSLMLPAPVLAQSDARIVGVVRDQSGSLVADARVTVTNNRTDEARTTTSNAQGYFAVPGLKPSTYTVKVEVPDFAPIDYPGMELRAAQELNLDFELRPAGVTEEVTVSAEAPIIDISSARIGANVSEREVSSLPINGRQMSQLLLQAPGSLNSGTGTWNDIRFSGRAAQQNVVKYDGVEGSAIIDASPGNLNGEIPTPFKLQASLENVQEFRVESNSYPAEFGTGTGGQVSVVTKSGSNALHGSAFGYIRRDRFDSPNYFDTAAGLPKSLLTQDQFGASLGGPLAQGRAFFFGSYEGYRLKAGLNFVEAVPSAAAAARAVPAIQPLIPGFKSPNAVILPGASTNPDYDIAQLQGVQDVREDAFSARLDLRINGSWSSYVRIFHDQGRTTQPEGVTGRVVNISARPSNVVWNTQGVLSTTMFNDFKVGYNSAPTRINGVAPVINGVDFSNMTLNLSGSVANTGIAGQGSSSGIAIPGGLVRANSATNGRGQPYDAYSLSFVDSLTWIRGSHAWKIGGEVRSIRMATDRLGGTTYTFANLSDFLANRAQTIQYLGDVSAPSAFNDGATGLRNTRQAYYIGFIQDEWHLNGDMTFNYGLRYEYYAPLRETRNLNVQFDIETGTIKDPSTPMFASQKDVFQPRVSFTYAPGKTVFRTGFGVFAGPGQTEDQIQPIESDRISSTLSGGVYPIDPAAVQNAFISNPADRRYQPRAYSNDYNIPERVYQYTASVQRELPGSMVASAAYVGSQGRNLFLRSVANRIVTVQTNPDPAKAAIVIREFDIVNPDGSISRPYAEVDYKTSGGHDNYNALQLSLTRRSSQGLTMNAQYTLARSFGNTGGSNEAQTSSNNAREIDDYDFDIGYNNFDVRHTFNLSAIYTIPYAGRGRALLGGWNVGAILNSRSGLPIDVKVVRPDVVYVDGAGSVFANPAAGRTAVINTPGGGASRNVRRPDLVPGVDPFVKDGGLVFLNPAAFAIPEPGTFGNLQRGSLHGPSFKQVDLVIAKRVETGGTSSIELRAEIFNLFNTDNFANPVGTLPQALPGNSLTEANKVQPGQPYTAGAAGTFGKMTSTVGRTVGLGTNRQVQFALRVNF